MADEQVPTVRYVLLAMLAVRPSTGLELAARLRATVGHFWSAPHSQIYPQLAALEAAGWADHEVVSAGEVRPRKRYSLTQSGHTRLRDWLTSPLAAVPERDELMVRAYGTAFADRPAAVAMYRELAAQAEQRVTLLEGFATELRQEYPTQHADPGSVWFGNWATIRAGIEHAQARARWCRWMQEQLQQF